ncbi:MAG: cupin domain-containing protein [Actinomycetota bacterium]|nr:cupin domain-containing protein [Actinomycetota bacterium]
MALVRAPKLEPMVDDPDDYRPASRWALLTDPGDVAGRVENLCMIVEEVGIGDRIPLHRHAVDEVVVILDGEAEVTLGDQKVFPAPGDVVFIPAGAVHGHRNVGEGPLEIHATFPSTLIDIEMLERNPGPGTEGDAPSHTVYDARTGEFWNKGDR